MRKARQFYQMFMLASYAHAKWDYETSMNILQSKRRRLIPILMALPIVLAPMFVSADALPELLGGKDAYSPAFYTTEIFVVSILIGMCAGLITGCIGAGGGVHHHARTDECRYQGHPCGWD